MATRQYHYLCVLCPKKSSDPIQQGGQAKVEQLQSPIELVLEVEVIHLPLADVVLDKREGSSSQHMIVNSVNRPVEMTLAPLVISDIASTNIPSSPWWIACKKIMFVRAKKWFLPGRRKILTL